MTSGNKIQAIIIAHILFINSWFIEKQFWWCPPFHLLMYICMYVLVGENLMNVTQIFSSPLVKIEFYLHTIIVWCYRNILDIFKKVWIGVLSNWFKTKNKIMANYKALNLFLFLKRSDCPMESESNKQLSNLWTKYRN